MKKRFFVRKQLLPPRLFPQARTVKPNNVSLIEKTCPKTSTTEINSPARK
mgnify:CR=1 FL=1